MSRKGLGYLVAGISVLGVAADLPVHCMYEDVVGTWEIRSEKTTVGQPTLCGSDLPNTNLANLRLMENNHGLSEDIQRVVLTDEVGESPAYDGDKTGRSTWTHLLVKDESGNVVGHWTNVFDEGVDIVINGKSYFSFFKYRTSSQGLCKAKNGDSAAPNGEGHCYESVCNETSVGWVRSRETQNANAPKQHWGCFAAKRVSPLHAVTPTEEDTTPDQEENSVKKGPKKKVVSPVEFKPHTPSFLQMHSSKNVPTWQAKQYPELRDSITASRRRNRKDEPKPFSFIQTAMSVSVNSNAELDHSESKALQSPVHLSNFGYRAKPEGQEFSCSHRSTPSVDSLPKRFSWTSVSESRLGGENSNHLVLPDFKVANQGSCGSCYAVAMVYSMQMRLRIATARAIQSAVPEAPTEVIAEASKLSPGLSSQSALACSPYNQGCDGGFPYLTGKHLHDFGTTTSECSAYMADDKGCKFPNAYIVEGAEARTLPPACPTYMAADYGYVGGYYQSGNERAIMEEIMQHGPVSAALEAPDAFYQYAEGVIYDAITDHVGMCEDKRQLKIENFNGYEYTDHAVVITGWGVDEKYAGQADKCDGKFWIIRNSWGGSWGEDGHIRVCRGKNQNALENQTSYVDASLDLADGPKLREAAIAKARELLKEKRDELSVVEPTKTDEEDKEKAVKEGEQPEAHAEGQQGSKKSSIIQSVLGW